MAARLQTGPVPHLHPPRYTIAVFSDTSESIYRESPYVILQRCTSVHHLPLDSSINCSKYSLVFLFSFRYTTLESVFSISMVFLRPC